jgi:hypothetical protein|tara:strand:- start:495 stop:851 length:357 start_codon:yes stop_codon:yes gene_type:complete
MDLTKMDPMARKMNVHAAALSKALETGDAELAKSHISEILKVGDFMLEDINMSITKSDDAPSGINQFANGVPVIKYNERGAKFNPDNRAKQLPGTIISARTNSRMRPHTGTFGGYRPQ